MNEFKRIKPLTNIALASFLPGLASRDNSLYNLRVMAHRTDGFFMIKCDDNDLFMASFGLQGADSGNHIIAFIQATPSVARPEQDFYEIFVHGGARDVSLLCRNEKELVDALRALEEKGMEDVFTNRDWEAATEGPFDTFFDVFPTDQRFVVNFADAWALELDN